jgi:hypothetical protein
MASTIVLQDVVNYVRTFPDLEPVVTAGGFTQEPALTIANDVMQRFLAQNMDWKFNRANVPSILTVALQQDYVTTVTDLGWLEQGWRLDINNTTHPKPIFMMETVRDLAQTSYQANPFNISWVPNRLAIQGKWKASTAYLCGYGQAATPVSPIQQFIDANGNYLYINSSTLNLNLNTPGYNEAGFVAPTVPYGTSGLVQPVLPINSVAGTTVVDGTVTWTVADPDGIAIRLAPMPATSSLAWLITPVYQKKPPILTSLQNTLTPIPDEFAYLFRQGFLAFVHQHAGTKQAMNAYSQWEEALMIALRSVDREREDASFYPSQGLTGGSPYRYGMPIGPAWPFDLYGAGY